MRVRVRANPRPHLVQVLLDESECRWVSDQRSRPTALLNRVRQVPWLGVALALALTLALAPTLAPTR